MNNTVGRVYPYFQQFEFKGVYYDCAGSIDCLMNSLCDQMNSHTKFVGVGIVVGVVVVSWLLWSFMKWGDCLKGKTIFGNDLGDEWVRLALINRIKDGIIIYMLCYIGLIVYLWW